MKGSLSWRSVPTDRWKHLQGLSCLNPGVLAYWEWKFTLHCLSLENLSEPGFSQGFFSVLSSMEFWFLAAVVSGLLSWGHFISSDIIDLIAQILFKLKWAGRCLLLNSVLNLVIYIIDTLFWYSAVALLQFVLLKALYKYRWLDLFLCWPEISLTVRLKTVLDRGSVWKEIFWLWYIESWLQHF